MIGCVILPLALPVNRADQQIFEDSEILERVWNLIGACNSCPAALVWSLSRDVDAVQTDMTRVRLQVASNQIEQTRLAGSVRADNADGLTRTDGEQYAVGRAHGAE